MLNLKQLEQARRMRRLKEQVRDTAMLAGWYRLLNEEIDKARLDNRRDLNTFCTACGVPTVKWEDEK